MRQPIALRDLTLRPLPLWRELLLTAGDHASGDFNAMTIGWGFLGAMWNLPVMQVVVRPSRYTYEFMERHRDFTVCAFGRQHSPALNLLGTLSGRDGDKIAQSGLTPIPSQIVSAPSYSEAELVFECRTIYWNDLEPAHFLIPEIHEKYPEGDFHRMYYGQILQVSGVPSYRAQP